MNSPPDEVIIRALDRVVLYAHDHGLARPILIKSSGLILAFGYFVANTLNDNLLPWAAALVSVTMIFVAFTNAQRADKSPKQYNARQVVFRQSGFAWMRVFSLLFLGTIAILVFDPTDRSFQSVLSLILNFCYPLLWWITETFAPETPIGKFSWKVSNLVPTRT